MLHILNEHYYLDLDRIDEYVQVKDTKLTTTGVTDGTHISVIKYDTVKLMIEILMDEPGEIDETLGIKKATSELSIPFKLAFNTLLFKKLLNKI